MSKGVFILGWGLKSWIPKHVRYTSILVDSKLTLKIRAIFMQ